MIQPVSAIWSLVLLSCCSVAQSCQTLCNPMSIAYQVFLSFTVSQSLLKIMSIELMMPSKNLTVYLPLLLPPSVFLSMRVFFNEINLHIRWPKYWSFNFSISPFNEYSELISFRIDWFDHLAVHLTLESSPRPQFKSINSLVLIFPYGPTLTSIHDYWKNHHFDYMDFCQ